MNVPSPARRLFSLSILLWLAILPFTGGRAQEPPAATPAPPELPAQAVEGTWKVTPLAQKGAAETGSTSFPEFGYGYWVDSGELVFWARAGADKNDWALLSLKNGQVRKIAQHDVEFTEPDGFKKKIRRGLGGYVPAGKLLYVNVPLGRIGIDSNVYIWDGERLSKVLAKEDSLQIGSTTYTLDSVAVFGVRRDGMAMISYRTDKPKKTSGCLLHDGTRLVTTLLPDPLPGLPGVSPNVEGEVSYCPLFPGATFLYMSVKGAPYKSGVFRLTAQKAEKLLADGDPDPFQEGKQLKLRYPPTVWATGPDTAILLGPLGMGKLGLELTIVAYDQGKVKTVPAFLRESKGFNAYDRGYVYFPHPGEVEVLFTVMLQNINYMNGRVSKILPDLYHFDGARLMAVPWEQVLGKEIGSLKKGTGSLLDLALYGLPRRIEMRAVPGQARGVILEMPVKKDDPKRTWYLDTNAKEFKLTRVPEFQVTGSSHHFDLDDVFAWKSETEALVRTEDGFFLLTRQ
jgi:hypothetical protein